MRAEIYPAHHWKSASFLIPLGQWSPESAFQHQGVLEDDLQETDAEAQNADLRGNRG